jgi:hypothetical protein
MRRRNRRALTVTMTVDALINSADHWGRSSSPDARVEDARRDRDRE